MEGKDMMILDAILRMFGIYRKRYIICPIHR
jgi:hypothetical protein